jgi:antitoxin HigA-1
MMENVLNNKGNSIDIEAFHPGVFLLEEIETQQLVKKDIAKALDILPNHLSDIFVGKRNISAKLAIKLETVLGSSAHYWFGMQAQYDLFLAKETEFKVV